MISNPGRVAILLSTFNGERYLTPQLHSLLGQTFRDWVLYWRDDGSTDGTVSLMQSFLGNIKQQRVVALECAGRIGSTDSFMHLLRRAHADGLDYAAFADQDDVWLPEKLARSVAALRAVPDDEPALYFGRQVLVDSTLRRIAISFPLRQQPGFPACLTQNLATGCTIMMNRALSAKIVESRVPAACLHDWWCYIVVSACGGRILPDPEPTVLYRQHEGNSVGAPPSAYRRAIAALRRGPAPFTRLMRQNVAALAEQNGLLTDTARGQLAVIEQALSGSAWARLRVLAMPGLRRQTWLETMLFRLWFLLR
jgi:glycosyltransferase involved in cell wall biosynthesis